MLSKIIWAVLLSSISSSVVGQKPQFERNNRTYQRPIVGQSSVELPCVVYNVTATMELSWQRNNKLITRGSEVVTEDDGFKDDGFSILHDKPPNSYMLTINHVQPTDSGNYECVVTMTRGLVRYQVSKIFRLEVIQRFPQPGWRGDGRCGENNLLFTHMGHFTPLSHIEAGCDGLGSNPCCSRDGWCRSFTDEHCNCPSCVDYSAIEASPCGPGFQLVWLESTWFPTSTCVHVGKTSTTYETARRVCEYLSATLIPKYHRTFQEITALAAGFGNRTGWHDPGTMYWVARPLHVNLLHCWAVDRKTWYYEYHKKNCQDAAAYPLCVKNL